jgi:hypothetical protein
MNSAEFKSIDNIKQVKIHNLNRENESSKDKLRGKDE